MQPLTGRPGRAGARRRLCWPRRAAALLLAAVIAGGACGVTGRPDVILISIDTLRADRLGAYGATLPTSPSIDRLREDSVLFREVVAAASSTLPSHASIFTSMIPQHHGASHTAKFPLPEGAITLAEVLRDAGYRTVAFHGGAQLDSAFGLGQGFEVYETVEKLDDLVDRTVKSLEQGDGRPTFLFLHTYAVHHPYTPRPASLEMMEGDYDGPLPDTISVDLLKRINRGEVELGPGDLEHIEATYEAEIHDMDAAMGRLFDHLREDGRYAESLIFFTSDHGEEFGEHGWVGWHSHTLYEELLRVPLLIKFPERRWAGAAVTGAIRSLDIAPTLLATLGVPVPDSFEGQSLLPSISARRAPPSVTILWREDARKPEIGESGIRADGWKLQEHGLFDLRSDPAESRDRSADLPEKVEALERRLLEAVAGRTTLSRRPIEIDGALIERLETLGYVH